MKKQPILFGGIPIVGRMPLFRADMRQAIRDLKKTQTRRVIKKRVHNDYGIVRECPYGKVGDIRCLCEPLERCPSTGRAYYRDDAEDRIPVISLITDKPIPWRWSKDWLASIHMPTEAARTVCRITGLRIERLQDISEEDAEAEGIQWLRNELDGIHQWKIPDDKDGWFDYVTDAFRYLWDSINGKKHPWKLNQQVWCISFGEE